MTDRADVADEADVRAACASFYEAANEVLGGNPAPMLHHWSHADDVSYCDTRGEVQRGWPAVEAYWKQAAAGNVFTPVQLHAGGRIAHVLLGGDLACIVVGEEVRREGEPGAMQTRATNVYRREDGTWRMVHRHADAPPKVDRPEAERAGEAGQIDSGT
jgi:ketosteroid isomerase-like protein